MKEDELLGLLMSMDDTEVVREEIIKPPFSYPGGKMNSIPMILPHLPYTDYYREPFGGSGAVLLARQKVRNEYFNDRFSGVTDFYHCVKNSTLLPKLLEWLDFSPCSREEFIRCRDTWKNIADPVERAARWYVQILTSFQSYARHWGRTKDATTRFSMKLPNCLSRFWPVHYRLQGVYIENQDWRQMFLDLDNPEAVWYLDPPYLNVTDYMYECRMPRQEHIEMCNRIFELQGFVALSGYKNDVYDNYPWTKCFSWETRETSNAGVGTESNHRKGTEGTNSDPRTEYLWIKDFS